MTQNVSNKKEPVKAQETVLKDENYSRNGRNNSLKWSDISDLNKADKVIQKVGEVLESKGQIELADNLFDLHNTILDVLRDGRYLIEVKQ